MAVTKILARKGRLDIGIDYILNGDKTEQKILTAHQGCEPGRECRQMLETKRDTENMGGVQYYHIVQSFKPGEISPELALEIAKTFAAEHLDGYEAVIATHVDRGHIHSHIVFNSVNADTGEKYHSNARSYYCQIRAISDRLCREHGLSVILSGETSKSMSYVEWLRQSKGQPTFRSMLEADLRESIEDANDLGHFFLLMEHKGYEIRHGNRLGFRLRGQERFQYPGRKNATFTENGIRAAILGNLEEIETGQRAAFSDRPMFRPYRRHPKYTGFLALYVHYLYLLGKIEQRQYPPRMTPHLRQEVMKFEQYRTQFAFLRENNISTTDEMTAYQALADRMNADNIPFSQESPLWNKHKIKRILENSRYAGGNGYPPIIDQDTFQQVQEKISEKTSGKFPRRTESDGLWQKLRSGCCQTRLLRTGGPIGHTGNVHLKCSACRNAFVVGKEELLAQTARQLAAHEKPICKPYAPSAEAVRLANAINRALEQPGDGKEALSHILQGAAARYACCDDGVDTAVSQTQPDQIDWERFERTVSHIIIGTDNAITVHF